MSSQTPESKVVESGIVGSLKLTSVVILTIASIIGSLASLFRSLGEVTPFVLAGSASLIATVVCVHVRSEREPKELLETEGRFKYPSWRAPAPWMAAVVVSISGAAIALKLLSPPPYPAALSILLVNRSGTPDLKIQPEAKLLITRSVSPAQDAVVTTGMIDLEVVGEKSSGLDGPWIRLHGANNALRGTVRNAERFKSLYEAGECKAMIIIESERNMYRYETNFRRQDFENLFIQLGI
ncbi:MAG: hypothetical protein JSR77_15145 [Planctomycetes bacterium]|nr:hypothetical protein [Planctomycetota bacterium]